MIIAADSFFRKPPVNLCPKQVVVFDAIRYSLDICDLAYERLLENLHHFVYGRDVPKPSFPLMFSDVWTIIQNVAIFQKIVVTHFQIENNDPYLDTIKKVKELRDSSQHIDERITQVLSKEDLPVYGTLSWYSQKEMASREGIVTTLYSGAVTSKRIVRFNPVNPAGRENVRKINDIQFSAIVKPNRKADHYEERVVLINEVMEDTQKLIRHFEQQLEDQFKRNEVAESHTADFILQLELRKGDY